MTFSMKRMIGNWANALFLKVVYDADYCREKDRIDRTAQKYRIQLERTGPERELWRSVAQYRCQSYARRKAVVILANLLAIAAMPLVILRFLRWRQPPLEARLRVKYLKIDFHMAYVVPNLIKTQTIESQAKGKYFYLEDLKFILRLFMKSGVFLPELFVKFLLWMASVRPQLDEFEPEVLIQYCEFSAYSSLRKAYLNHLGTKIANITHGEEVISTRNAFSTFDQYFAWSITPPEIHQAMGMEYATLYHFNPCENLPKVPPHLELTTVGILWPSIMSPAVGILVEQINLLGSVLKVVVRPHPNPNYACDIHLYRSRLKAEVCDPKAEGVHDFIDRCSVVVGFPSAVLLQALFREGKVLYLENEPLENIRRYHPFYQKVDSVAIEDLAARFLDKINRPPSGAATAEV